MIPATCLVQEKPDGTWFCPECNEIWPAKPSDCTRELKQPALGAGGMEWIERFQAMTMPEKLALFISGPVEDVGTDSRYELEEVQIHAWDRLTDQERCDRLRRAVAMARMLEREHLIEAPDEPAEAPKGSVRAAYPIQVKKKANLYIERLEQRAPHLRSIVRAESNRQTLRAIFCELIDALVGGCVPYEGEPSFTLLARDPQAPHLVDEWAFERSRIAPEQIEKIANAFDRSSAMLVWKAEHPGFSLPSYERKPKVPVEDAKRLAAAKDLLARVQRVLRAPADIWSVSDLMPLLTDCGAFISFFVPNAQSAGQLPAGDQTSRAAPASGADAAMALPVDSRTPEHILMLFRLFVFRNATQWVTGANDHHHPIWERVAAEVEDIPEPTAGAEWLFIQPMNRKSLGMLEAEQEQKA